MDIDKIKAAIKLGGGLIHPNPDGTIAIMPRDLNEFNSISLDRDEYKIYIESTLLTENEKFERLEKIMANQEIEPDP